MKRLFILAFLPLVLFALEPVNLIKDPGFEKDSEVWEKRTKIIGLGDYDSTVINRHDPDSAYLDHYCGSIDTRIKPAEDLPFAYVVEGHLYQIVVAPKQLSDLDSLEFYHMVTFREGSKSFLSNYAVSLRFIEPSTQTRIRVWYTWRYPGWPPPRETSTDKFFCDTTGTEGVWYNVKRDLIGDIYGIKGLSPDIELDTFSLYGDGIMDVIWRGQKAFFDGIRLMGFADYDVGVKEILSGDSVWEGVYYKPVARIKNFGREDAPEFSVIAEIWEGETRVYYDSLLWSLTSDTEDTFSFADFTPTNAANHTLTVRTVMEPDESDEDDELSKTLFGTGISEQPQPQALTLEVRSLTRPLCVSYSLPYGEHGTLTLYDAAGRRIEHVNVRGSGSIDFTAPLSSGVYLVRLETSKRTLTRKAVVLR